MIAATIVSPVNTQHESRSGSSLEAPSRFRSTKLLTATTSALIADSEISRVSKPVDGLLNQDCSVMKFPTNGFQNSRWQPAETKTATNPAFTISDSFCQELSNIPAAATATNMAVPRLTSNQS